MAALGCWEPARPSIVLIVVDTLRADHLGTSGSAPEASPRIADLAASGTLYREAVAASPWTGPAVASIVSGRYPDHVGVRGLRQPLPASVVILPQILSDAGYATAAVVSNALAGPANGTDRGYDHFYFEHYRSQSAGAIPVGHPSFTADRVSDHAIDWIEDAPRPYFLFLHYTDPHEPYLPPPRWRDPLASSEAAIDETLLLGKRFTREPLAEAELSAVRARYRAEIAFVDHEIGRLLEVVGDDAVVALTGDHGEEFREHGGFLHGHSLYQELLHVPLILAGPGVPMGKTVTTPVSHVDILPTLIKRAGLRAPVDFDGRDLLEFVDAPAPSDATERVLFSILEGPTARCVAARRGNWKLSTCRQVPGNVLRDLSRDPDEDQRKPPGSAPIEAELVRAIAEHDRRVVTAPAASDPESARRLEEALRAIGYVE